MASELVRALRDIVPDDTSLSMAEYQRQCDALDFAADALDARDRDVAELVAALGGIVADFDRRAFVLNAAIAADGPPVRSIANARLLLAKHKGGA